MSLTEKMSLKEKMLLLQGCTRKIQYQQECSVDIKNISRVLTLHHFEMAWLVFRNSEKCIEITKNKAPREPILDDDDKEIIDIIYPMLEEIFTIFVSFMPSPLDAKEDYLLIFENENQDQIMRITHMHVNNPNSLFSIQSYETIISPNDIIHISLCCTLDRFRKITGDEFKEYNDTMICHKNNWITAMEALSLQAPLLFKQ